MLCIAFSIGNDILDIALVTIPVGVLGARLYYVVFSEDRATYFANPLSILKIWEGGLAIYGGVIGAAVIAVGAAVGAAGLSIATMVSTSIKEGRLKNKNVFFI